MTEETTQLAVIGAGPGGYPAAFLAADLGVQTTLIDPETAPGGVCLLRGCIPSKALLHLAHVLTTAREASAWGIDYAPPRLDLDRMRAWKDEVVAKLTDSLAQQIARRGIRRLRGRARFRDAGSLEVRGPDGAVTSLRFEHAIVATGSRPIVPSSLTVESPHVFDSTGALALPSIPKSLLVIGGGYIGLELGSVYAALGSKVTVVEMTAGLLPGVDRDLVSVLTRRLDKLLEAILLRTTVAALRPQKSGVKAVLRGQDGAEQVRVFQQVLVAVGRQPNSRDLGLENTRAELSARGFIMVDAQRRTAEPGIFAIGDVAGEPMLAHKATHEGRVAVEAIAGRKVAWEPRAIPAVVFTDPEIAWCGLTETEARAAKRAVRTAKLPWGASGRAATLGRAEGLTKVIIDPETERLLGVGIAGPGAGELIAEAALAVEMAAVASDLRLTIHAHPTLSETLMEAAETLLAPRAAKK